MTKLEDSFELETLDRRGRPRAALHAETNTHTKTDSVAKVKNRSLTPGLSLRALVFGKHGCKCGSTPLLDLLLVRHLATKHALHELLSKLLRLDRTAAEAVRDW